jgi:hypothetical protein
MHLYININKVLPKSHIHIWARKVSRIVDMIFFNHIQELGFKGLGFRQSLHMGFHHKEWGDLCNFHILLLLSFSLSAPPHYCPFILQDNFVAMKL